MGSIISVCRVSDDTTVSELLKTHSLSGAIVAKHLDTEDAFFLVLPRRSAGGVRNDAYA